MDAATLIVGGGPAGLAPLLAASRSPILDELLGQGVVIAERGGRLGGGAIGRYLINSDSPAASFLAATESLSPGIAAVARGQAGVAVAARDRAPVPLGMAAALLDDVGDAMRARIEAHPGGRVLLRHDARWTRRVREGWVTRLTSGTCGAAIDVHSRSVILATGGGQPRHRLVREIVGGAPLLPRLEGRLTQSDEALTAPGLARIVRRLRGVAEPRVVVVGGGSSALSVAGAMLQALDQAGVRLGETALTLMHRQELRFFYPDPAAALADGYDQFEAGDICPLTGFVNRFSGLRYDNRELGLRLYGLGGRAPEPRISLHRLDREPAAATDAVLARADLVIACLGYRPNALPVYDHDDVPVPLLCDRDDRAPLADARGRVLDADGVGINGLLAIGLASGLRPDRAFGGEASFAGQFNGLWLWQHDIGEMVARQALDLAGRKAGVQAGDGAGAGFMASPATPDGRARHGRMVA